MNHHRLLIALTVVTVVTASALGGCGSLTPNYDTRFGDALRQARLDMTRNPDAGQQASDEELMDGTTAQQAITRYHAVPRAAPAPAPLVNIMNAAPGGAPGY